MNARPWLALLLLAAGCPGESDEPKDTDTDADTEVTETDTDETDVVETDLTDTADTDVVTETDDTEIPVDTDGETITLHGTLWCVLPHDTGVDTDTDLDTGHGIPIGPGPIGGGQGKAYPATPGTVQITLVQPWNCPPLSSCNKLENYEILAETTVDKDGVFDLTFQTNSYSVDELYLYTDNPAGTCGGNGYHFTQWKLTDYEDWSDIVIDVDSIFY